jgi:hypothetical protein
MTRTGALLLSLGLLSLARTAGAAEPGFEAVEVSREGYRGIDIGAVTRIAPGVGPLVRGRVHEDANPKKMDDQLTYPVQKVFFAVPKGSVDRFIDRIKAGHKATKRGQEVPLAVQVKGKKGEVTPIAVPLKAWSLDAPYGVPGGKQTIQHLAAFAPELGSAAKHGGKLYLQGFGPGRASFKPPFMQRARAHAARAVGWLRTQLSARR